MGTKTQLGALELTLTAPDSTVLTEATVAGAAQLLSPSSREVVAPLQLRKGETVPFTLRWK